MRIERAGDEVRITLKGDESKLLRHALERASFIDTPLAEQERIQDLCARLLEALGSAQR